MLIKMKRSVKTGLGMLAMGVTYDLSDKDPKQVKVAKDLLDRELATKTTEAKLKKELADQAAKQQAAQADVRDGAGLKSAMSAD